MQQALGVQKTTTMLKSINVLTKQQDQPPKPSEENQTRGCTAIGGLGAKSDWVVCDDLSTLATCLAGGFKKILVGVP